MIKAILIDPGARSLQAIEIASGTDAAAIEELYDLVNEPALDAARIAPGEAIYVGDHSALQDPPLPAYWIEGYPHLLYGRGVLVGFDAGGRERATKFTVDELSEIITWCSQMSYLNQQFAILENNQIKCVTLEQWAEWMGGHQEERIIGRDEIEGYRVSTIFMGLDHQWDPRGRPLYWETRIFKPARARTNDLGKNDMFHRHYSTAEEAREGHTEAVEWLKAKLENRD